jgi:hypothetical protein
VMRFVEKDDRDAIKECVESCCKRSKR